VLTAHDYALVFNEIVASANGSDGSSNVQGAETTSRYRFTDSDMNAALSKFRGKVRSGDASLGVTLASWRQSRDMITSRLNKINLLFDSALRKRTVVRRASKTRRTANAVLEGEFGWVPLLADVHAAVFTVAGRVPPEWVRAAHKLKVLQVDNNLDSNPRIYQTLTGDASIVISANVAITNPNAWLLNKAGLINPLTVAWDLVPWSFVVNMFVNVNQVLSSLTDDVGLTYSNGSITRSSSVLREQRAVRVVSPSEAYTSFANVKCKTKDRESFVTLPTPRLSFKVPNFSWETAVIASSLIVQKLKKF
jgi:hypothetical protein